ncbi:MAG: PD-(D/E)XK nuclease family protein [Oscillospiraceae bacterium]|jgi:ATP-dependent helicase/nuclease subunit B|nr:PD-(D/E)XK nuclease family protein [Oscillospiraceae bacterium]
MLKLIYGRAGTGKTHFARELAAQLASEGAVAGGAEGAAVGSVGSATATSAVGSVAGVPVGAAVAEAPRTVLIIPEQYSFETEKKMLLRLSAKGIENIEIFSFSRLAEELGSRFSGNSRPRLSDTGRAAAVALSLRETADSLTLYRKKKSGASFISHILHAVKEFKMCGITPDMLLATAGEVQSEPLRVKLSELSLIYSAFEGITARSALDPLDELTRLAGILKEHRYFEGKTVIFDSFRGLTKQELTVIGEIAAQAAQCVVTLCSDGENEREGGAGLFSPVRKTAAKLIAEARRRGVPVAVPEVLPCLPRYKSKAIAFLNRSIFTRQEEAYEGEAEEISVYAARDRYQEVQFAAAECRRLLREEGYRCRDIAIIARNEGDYSELLSNAMDMQSIPCFIDRRSPVDCSPLIRFVETALTLSSADDIIVLLKTGMIDLSSLSENGGKSGNSDTERLIAEVEEYVLLWGISAAQWRMEFTSHPRGFEPELTEEDKQLLSRINCVRRRFCEVYLSFSEEMKGASGTQAAKAIFSLLERAGSAECIERLCSLLPPSDAQIQAQIWEVLIDILEQLHSIIGDGRLSREEYSELFSVMLSECSVGQIPQGLDEICFGAADRIRPSSPKAVFILGAADGVFPASVSGGGVFTDSERAALIAHHLEVAEPAEQVMLEERLLCYNAMMCASERLYISYPVSGGRESNSPSEIIYETERLIKNHRKIELLSPFELSESANSAFEQLCVCYGEKDERAYSLRAALQNEEEVSRKLSAVEQSSAVNMSRRITDPALRSALYGKNMYISPSRAEQYFQCPFSYFCKYTLGASGRRKAELNPITYGNTVHYVLENALREHSVKELHAISEGGGLRGLVSRYIDSYIEITMGGERDKSARFLYLVKRLSGSVTDVLQHLVAEFSQSAFRPVAFELEIGRSGDIKPLTLQLDGGTITIGGKADRVDACVIDGKPYVRVVDYKTGKKEFSLAETMSGLNLQMPIYLDLICNSGKLLGEGENAVAPDKDGKYRAAGVLYVPSKSEAEDASRAAALSSSTPNGGPEDASRAAALSSTPNSGQEDTSRAAALSSTPNSWQEEGSKLTTPSTASLLPPSSPNSKQKGKGKLTMSGMVVDDMNVLEAMERRLMGEYIPVSLTKNGISASSKAVPAKTFDYLARHIRELLREMGQMVMDGNIDISPSKSKYSACDYCEYKPVCRNEDKQGQRSVLKLKQSEAVRYLFDKYREEDE